MDDSSQYYLKMRGKVRGPFSVEQLRRMTARGQFSRLHQVSIDKQTWESADELLSGFHEAKTDSAAEEAAASTEGIDWHYALADEKYGPVSELELIKKIHLNNIKPDTLLWNPNLTDWKEASDVFPELFNSKRKKRSRGKIVILSCLVLLLITGLTVGGFYLIPQLNLTSVVQSPDEAIETEATGLVFFYLRVRLKTGEESELPFGSGTCFVVNKNGAALTNRHVIKNYQLWNNASEEGKTQRLIDHFGLNSSKSTEQFKMIGMLMVQKVAEISPELKVHFGENEYSASLEYVSGKFDMAVLQIKDYEGKSYFSLSNNNECPQLTKVVALGFPGTNRVAITQKEQAIVEEDRKPETLNEIFFGTRSHLDGTKESALGVVVTPGEVSVVQREAEDYYIIQHTATIREGNSGGPLVIREERNAGVVAGINTSYLKDNSPVYISFPVAQMRDELENDAGLKNLTWR